MDYEGWHSDKAWQDSYLIRLGIPGSDSLERCGFDGDTASLAPAVDTSTMLYHPVPGWSRPVAAGSYRVSRQAYAWSTKSVYDDVGLLTVMQDGPVKASFGSGVTGTGWLLLTESASDAASDVARILLVLEDAYGYEEGVVVRPDVNPTEAATSDDMRWTSVDGPIPTL